MMRSIAGVCRRGALAGLAVVIAAVAATHADAASRLTVYTAFETGFVEQVGTPAEIYGEPVNAFVADFIGQMNFLPGTVVDEDRIRLGRIDLRHRATGAGANLQPGAPVTLCVRPEDVQVAGEHAGASDNSFSAQVAELDFIGNFFRARLAADLPSAWSATARSAPADPQDAYEKAADDGTRRSRAGRRPACGWSAPWRSWCCARWCTSTRSAT